MGTHAMEARQSGRFTKKRLTLAAAVTAAASTVLGAGIYASWTSTDQISTGTYNAATVGSSFTDTGTNAFSTAVDNMVPGDTTVHYTDLKNAGSVTQQFTGSVTSVGDLAGPGGLTVAIERCSVAWAADGTCDGTATSVLDATPTSDAPSITYGPIAASVSMHLKVTVALPSDAPTALAGTNGTVTINEVAGIASTGSDRSAG
ncbi:MAG TPA: hypothetical protein VHE83_06505 [Mycobacteriales bacterium]|nr:hypothetical protein [Mycobacteriales bacterium]